MIPPLRDRRSRSLGLAALIATLVAAGAIFLRRFPPARYSFYPRCPIDTYLHLQCPGCGTTRALAAMAQGRFHQAFYLNPLTTILLPTAVLYIVRHLWLERHIAARTLPQPPSYAIYMLLVFAAIFTVVRNLP